MSTKEDRVQVTNEGPSPLEVAIEPWGGSHWIKPGESLVVVGRGPSAGRLKVLDVDNVRTVWGWSGSTVWVYQDERLLEHYTPQVP